MSDRRLWLEEPCPTCGARSGLRCQTSRYGGKPTGFLDAGRGWRHRPCPICKARPGQLCKTPTGRRASQPHTPRLQRGRRELFAEEQVWEELERWETAVALVRFSGGGGNQGSIAAVTLEDAKKCELARWGSGEGELPEALAAPIWGRYARFRGHPVAVITADTSRRSAARARRETSRGAGAGDARLCERCGEPLPAGLRAEARYCSKRCRQAASRQRLKDRPPSPPPSPPETCSWCGGPMPSGLRVEAQFCSKRCRQASSRHALRVRRSAPKTSSPHGLPRPRGAKAQG